MRYPYIDMHCDTLLRTYREEPERLYDGRDGMQGFRLMQEAGQMCQFSPYFSRPGRENSSLRCRQPMKSFLTGYAAH